MDKVKSFLSGIAKNWGKGIFVIFSTLVFLIVLFPLDDINDFISAQIAKATNNQIFVKFSHINFNLLPHFGLSFEDISIATPMISEIQADKLTVSPSITAAIKQKPEGSIYLTGFLNGDLSVEVKSAGKSENGVDRTKISIEAKQLQLAKLKDVLKMPGTIKSSLDFDITGTVDLTFKEQPDIDFTVKGDNIVAKDVTIDTLLGPFVLPEFKFNKLNLKGRLAGGQFNFENSTVDGKELSINLKRGALGFQLNSTGGTPYPMFSSYDFDLNLSIQKNMEEKLYTFLTFIDKFKTPKNTSEDTYSFKISGQNFMGPPNMSALR